MSSNYFTYVINVSDYNSNLKIFIKPHIIKITIRVFLRIKDTVFRRFLYCIFKMLLCYSCWFQISVLFFDPIPTFVPKLNGQSTRISS